jgi:outer membrane protein TolC
MTFRDHLMIGCLLWLCSSSPVEVRAQEHLPLEEAIAAVLAGNPDVAAAGAAAQEAAQQMPQARAGFLPRLDFTQSWQRGNQPVFVFGSLLAQRQFAEADFALQQLNTPEPLTNSRSALAVEQPVFDGGRTRAAVRIASLSASAAIAGERQVRNDLQLAATRAYGQVLRAGAGWRAAESAVAAAEENARTAEARRDAGTGTEADVLSMRVHLAEMRARAIDAASGERIARAELNRLMHTTLDREWILDEPTTVMQGPPDADAVVERALRQRPEIEQAALRSDVSRATQQSARSALLPQLVVQGGYEWNDGQRGGPAGSWIAGANLRVSLFSGGANVARMRQASFAVQRTEAERVRAEAAVRLEVLTALEQLGAARARQDVGRAAVMQARESERMIRDRYEAGIAPATDAIRAATAVLDAESQRINALVDLLVAEAALHRATGQEVHP